MESAPSAKLSKGQKKRLLAKKKLEAATKENHQQALQPEPIQEQQQAHVDDAIENAVPVDSKEDEKEIETTFEEELAWCTKQLKVGMKNPRVTKEQIAESNEVIRKLENPKNGLPYKRHLMHVVFGEYRKMLHQEIREQAVIAKSRQCHQQNAM